MDNTNVGHLHPKTCLDPSDKSELSWLTIVLELPLSKIRLCLLDCLRLVAQGLLTRRTSGHFVLLRQGGVQYNLGNLSQTTTDLFAHSVTQAPSFLHFHLYCWPLVGSCGLAAFLSLLIPRPVALLVAACRPIRVIEVP